VQNRPQFSQVNTGVFGIYRDRVVQEGVCRGMTEPGALDGLRGKRLARIAAFR